MGRPDSIAAGEPCQFVDQFCKCLGVPGLLLLSILVVAVILVLELLLVPEVPDQGEID